MDQKKLSKYQHDPVTRRSKRSDARRNVSPLVGTQWHRTRAGQLRVRRVGPVYGLRAERPGGGTVAAVRHAASRTGVGEAHDAGIGELVPGARDGGHGAL